LIVAHSLAKGRGSMVVAAGSHALLESVTTITYVPAGKPVNIGCL
jgi:hypothetical protein